MQTMDIIKAFDGYNQCYLRFPASRFSIIINDEHCEEDDGQGEQEEFFPRSPALLKDIRRETDSWENIAEDFGQGEGRRGGGGGCEKEGGVWIFKTQGMHKILNCSKVH